LRAAFLFHFTDLFAAHASHAILFVLEILPEQCSFSPKKQAANRRDAEAKEANP
jgi:hypothetical protein